LVLVIAGVETFWDSILFDVQPNDSAVNSMIAKIKIYFFIYPPKFTLDEYALKSFDLMSDYCHTAIHMKKLMV
jgi:hypothetical protein